MSAKKKSPGKKKNGQTRIIKYELRESSGDLVQIQISARLKRVPKGFKITRELLNSFIREKARLSDGQWSGHSVDGASEGPNPPGIELKIIKWRNPTRKRGKRGRGGDEWRSGNQADAWGSLRRVLQAI